MNNVKLILVLSSLLLLSTGCVRKMVIKERVGIEPTLSISRVSVDKKTFDPQKDKKALIKFYISKPATNALIGLYDSNNSLIRLLKMQNLKQGFNAAAWDGKDEKGDSVKSDIVIYTITVNDIRGSLTYDPTDDTEGFEIHARDFSYDKKSGKIFYTLPRASRVRLRAGLKEGLLLNTIFDWEPREAGEHNYVWDGKDSSENLFLLKHPNLDLNLTCYTLPDNCLIIKGGNRNVLEDETLSKRNPKGKSQLTKYLHSLHKTSNCHEPDFTIEFPRAEINKDGLPILKGRVPVRVSIVPEDKSYMVNKRFEVMFYVDTVFFYEEEEGSSPFTFYWDTTKLNNGEHLLTVNIMSYDDHVGAKTKKVFIGGEK